MRSTFILTAAAFVLAACGSSEPDLEEGPDYSMSPLQVKFLFDAENPPNGGEIVFTWNEIEGATHYRFFVDENGTADDDLNFVQFGADVPAGGDDPKEIAYPISVHLVDWRNALFMLESCDADGCVEQGRQNIFQLSTSFITSILGLGNVVAISEQGDRMVIGFGSNSVFECEELIEVEPKDFYESCEYPNDLTDEEVEELVLFETIPAAGSLTVLTYIDGLWETEAFVTASNIGEGDGFGVDVAISDDGNTIVASANTEDGSATGVSADGETGGSDDDEPDSGAVYVFTRNVSGDEVTWDEVAYIKPSNTQGVIDTDDEVSAGDVFGSVVQISGDGETIVVSAFGEDSNFLGVGGETDGDDNSATNSGAVYVFRNNGGSWSQEAYIKPSNTDEGDVFGSSLAISTDGNRLAVGAIRESSSASGVDGDPFNNGSQNSGAVYIFERSGMAWSQQAYLKARNPDSADEFGFSVALNGPGDVLVVGAPQEDSDSRGVNGDENEDPFRDYNAGAGYIFEFDGANWSQTAYLKAANADPIDELGFHVASNLSGDRVLVTAIREGGVQAGVNPNDELNFFVGSGAAYLFVRDGDGWKQQAYLKSPGNSGGALYGWDADFAVDGDRLVITRLNFGTPGVYVH